MKLNEQTKPLLFKHETFLTVAQDHLDGSQNLWENVLWTAEHWEKGEKKQQWIKKKKVTIHFTGECVTSLESDATRTWHKTHK